MQRGQRAELLGDDQRGVVRQHDAAGADPDGAGAGGDMGECDRGRSTGYARHVVMLGHPISRIAQCLDVAGQIERVAQRLASVAAFGNRRQVENRQRYHALYMDRKAASGECLARLPLLFCIANRFLWHDAIAAQDPVPVREHPWLIQSMKRRLQPRTVADTLRQVVNDWLRSGRKPAVEPGTYWKRCSSNSTCDGDRISIESMEKIVISA